jgi:oligopeptide/dipeptide ABC transporter ATP-binding protein
LKPLHVVRGIDLSLKRGSRTAILGETGCGKSVTAMAIFRLLPKDAQIEGRICLNDNLDLLELSHKAIRQLRGKKMVFLPQSAPSHLNPVFTVGFHLKETIRHQNIEPQTDVQGLSLRLLETVGFSDPEKVYAAYPHELSGGMSQRVLLSVGLAARPALLVADEPTRGLDVDSRDQYLGLTRKLFRDAGFLMITHDLEAAQSCEEVVIMYGGRFVEAGPTSAVLGQPNHPYTQGLIAAHPAGGLNPIPGNPPRMTDDEKGCVFHPRCCFKTHECCTITPGPGKKAGITVWCHHA